MSGLVIHNAKINVLSPLISINAVDNTVYLYTAAFRLKANRIGGSITATKRQLEESGLKCRESKLLAESLNNRQCRTAESLDLNTCADRGGNNVLAKLCNIFLSRLACEDNDLIRA